MDEPLEQLAAAAAGGDRDALERFLRRISDDVYNLCLRMLGHPADAEDATQEILVKVTTSLGSFRGESGIRTWIWRIATNHVVSARRGRREPEGAGFEGLDGMLAAGLAAGAPPPPGVDEALLEEEVKLGCTQAMLLCLDREHRLAFVLGDVFGLDGTEGAEALAIEPAAFRKRLSRARARIREFMEARCGLVSPSAACRCRKQVGPSVAVGVLDPERPVYAVHPHAARRDPVLWRSYRAIEAAHRTTAVLRSHPDYAAPESLVAGLREALG